jgi:hypothetical protein
VLALRREKFGPDNYDTLMSMWGVAANLIGLDQGKEAVTVIDECFQRAAGLAVKPNLLGLSDLRLKYFADKKDAAGCQRTAELWESLQRTDAASLYGAARYRAVTSAVRRAAIAASDAAQQADLEADRAMTWLKLAVAAGYHNQAALSSDRDLDALRERADFRELLERLGRQR